MAGIMAKRMEKEAKKKELQARIEKATEEKATEEEQQKLKKEMDDLEESIKVDYIDYEQAEQAEQEEKSFETEEEDKDSEMEVEDTEDHDKPSKSIEDGKTNSGLSALADQLRNGLRLAPPKESPDLITAVGLRPDQSVVCYKDGVRKPAIVLDLGVPEYPIYKIRNDVPIDDSYPNLMNWRHAGKRRDAATKKKGVWMI